MCALCWEWCRCVVAGDNAELRIRKLEDPEDDQEDKGAEYNIPVFSLAFFD